MKTIRVTAVLLALAMLFTGCKSRSNDDNSSSQGIMEDIESRIEDAGSEIREDVEDGISRLEDDFDISHNEAPQIDEPDMSEVPDMDELDESVAAAMTSDFSQIGNLDGEKKGWGPGGPTDSKGRPDGATVYQDRYGGYGAFFIGPNNGTSQVWLTFDEGYENSYTDDILDVLKEKNVKAVFFVTLPYAKTEAALVKRMIDEGHVVGNHSSRHKSFPELPLTEAARDIMELHDYMKETFGYEMSLFRPPMGEFSEQTLALTQSLGYQSVFWSFAYTDWLVDDQPLYVEALSNAVNKAHPGAIYLLHAVSQTNAEMLGEFIDTMRSNGYEFAEWNL